ncbi:MAG: hypothetical protein AAGD14_00875 [Planctomycetota bacterium]
MRLAWLLFLLPACAGPREDPEPPPPEQTPEDLRVVGDIHFLAAASATYRALITIESSSMEELLDAENRLPEDVRARVAVHASAGQQIADMWLEQEPDNAEAHLLATSLLGFEGIAKGKLSAFLEGIPNRMTRACAKLIELDETVRSAGPLQVQGRFRTIVPFPYRQLDTAIRSLERARGIAPVKQTLYFLGDAYAWKGRMGEAERTWRAALVAPSSERTEKLAGYIDQLVEQRLAMLK